MKIDKTVLALYAVGIGVVVKGLTILKADLGPGMVLTGIVIVVGSYVLHKKFK